MKLFDKTIDLLRGKPLLKYYLINLLLLLSLFGLMLGKLIMKEGNPFFYSDF